MKIPKKYQSSIVILASAIIGLAVFVVASRFVAPSQSRADAWKSFQARTASLQLSGETSLYKGNATMGCFENEAVRDSSLNYCTFSSTHYYALKGNYRDNGRRIYDFLKQHGYYFEDKSKQQELESTLSNTKIADNLSDAEPIVVDLQNSDGTWVRFSLGDKRRLMTPGSDNLSQALTDTEDDALIASLEFYRTL